MPSPSNTPLPPHPETPATPAGAAQGAPGHAAGRPPVFRVQAVPAAATAATATQRKPAQPVQPWRWRMLLAAPHRLGFFAAMAVLLAASFWWLLVQVQRAGAALPLHHAVAPVLTHAAVMVFGFMPLFFSGFFFTAGPRWLGVPPHSVRRSAPCVLLQCAGWLLWLAGAHLHATLALAGLALALAGLCWMVALFWQLINASAAPDRVHAKAVGVAGLVGVACLGGVCWAAWQQQLPLALVLVRTALWGFIVVTYVAVAHRMIPFFTSGVLPMIDVWRPFWVLWLMLGAAGFEALVAWLEWLAPPPRAAITLQTVALVMELLAGAVLLWLATVWGLVQSLKIRLLAMLHVGFVWLGVALVYGGITRAAELASGQPLLGLGALHALGMGFLGSLMLAMVTRVSCGHSGRALVADDAVWALFGLLQGCTMLRMLAAVQGMPHALLLAATVLWVAVMLPWCLRYASWYGRPRFDGKPG